METRGSRHDWNEDDDEESESVEEETWRGRADFGYFMCFQQLFIVEYEYKF